MIKKKFNNSGFSMAEVIISALLFAMTVSGVFAVVNSITQQNEAGALASRDVTATLFGQRVLDSLRSQINAGIPFATPLTDYRVETIGGVEYNAVYTITGNNTVGYAISMDVGGF